MAKLIGNIINYLKAKTQPEPISEEYHHSITTTTGVTKVTKNQDGIQTSYNYQGKSSTKFYDAEGKRLRVQFQWNTTR